MVSSKPNNRQIYDALRGIWVKATPEEVVRQVLLKKMVDKLGYPPALIAVEKQISELVSGVAVEVPQRRIDIVCFKKDLKLGLAPLLLIECKDEALSQKAIDQVVGYNAFLQAPYLSIVTPDAEIIGHFDLSQRCYHFRRGFPNYEELLQCV